ncbi:unnamed protein product, partial [Prunus brigantina]
TIVVVVSDGACEWDSDASAFGKFSNHFPTTITGDYCMHYNKDAGDSPVKEMMMWHFLDHQSHRLTFSLTGHLCRQNICCY